MKAWLIVIQLASTAWAAPRQRQDSCSAVCPVNENNLLPFKPGKAYVYDYSATSTTQAPDVSKDQSILRFQGGFIIRALTPCELSMTLEQGVIIGSKGRSTIPNQNYVPLRFSYRHGSIEHICPDDRDEEWILNIKKAILSHFETSGFLLSSPVDKTVQEDDVSGSCPASYKVDESWGKKTITKEKDLNKCGNRDGGQSIIQGHAFVSDALETFKTLPLTESSQSCTHDIQENEFKSIKCTENHAVNPFFMTSGSKHKLLQASVKTELTLRKVMDSQNNAKHFLQMGARGNESLFFNHKAYAFVPGVRPVAQIENLMRMACQKLEAGEIETVPGIFANLIHYLKYVSQGELKNLWISSKSSYICRDPKKTEDMFLSALPSVDTPASIAMMTEFLSVKGKATAVSPFWLTSMAFLSNPSVEMVGAMQKITLSEDPSQLLPVSAMAYTACSKNQTDCRGTVEIQRLNQAIKKRLIKQIRSSRDEDQVITALKSFGNLGYLTEESVTAIKELIPGASLPVQLAAIDSFRRVPCDMSDVQRLLMDTLKDTMANSAVRIFSYITLMKCPDSETIDSILEFLQKDDSNQVDSFIWSHMKNLEKSSNPLKADVKKMITEKLSASEAKETFDSDFRKFSRNFDLSMQLLREAGVDLESDVVFSSHSYIPAHLKTNLTINMFGKSVNILEVGAGFHGFEKVLEKVFGPDGYFSNKSSTEIWNDSQAIIAEGDKTFQKYLQKLIRKARGVTDKSTDEFHNQVNNKVNGPEEVYKRTPAADIYFRIFGHEIAWLPIHMTEGNFNEMATSFLGQLSRINMDVSPYNVKFLDSYLSLPTVMGFPLKFMLNGTATIDVKMNSVSESRNKNDLELRPGFAVEVQGHLMMDAYLMRTGMKTIARVFSSTGMKAKFSYTNRKIDMNIDLPNQKQTIFGVHSNTFLTHSDASALEVDETAIIPTLPETSSKKYSCFRGVEKALGLKFCYELNKSRKHIVDQYPIIYPFDMFIQVEKTDPSMRGYLIQAYQESGERFAVGGLFDTPGSRTNRKIKMDTSFSFDREVELMFSLENPIHNVELIASGINSNDLKKLEGKIVWGKDTYRATARADVVSKAAHTSITPFIEIFNGQQTIRVLEGKVIKSNDNVELDLTAPMLDVKAKGKVELLAGRGGGDQTFKIKDVDVTRGSISYSGSGYFKKQRDGGAIMEMDLRYDHGTPQTVKIRGMMDNQGQGEGIYYKGQLDFVNSESPTYNTRAKFNFLNKFAEKGATIANSVNLWYGRHYDLERENHLNFDQRFIVEHTDGINFVNSIKVLAVPYQIEGEAEQMFMWTEYNKQFRVKLIAAGSDYSADCTFRRKPGKLFNLNLDGKVVWPGQSITYSEALTEAEPGHYNNEGSFIMSPGPNYDFKASFQHGKRNSDVYYKAASVITKDRQELLKMTSDNQLGDFKVKSKSDLIVNNMKALEYDLKWENQPPGTHNFDIKMNVMKEVDVSFEGSYSKFSQKFDYQVKFTHLNSKVFGVTEVKTVGSASDLTSSLNWEHRQSSYFQGSLLSKSTPEFRSGKLKIKIPVNNVNFEVDSKIDSVVLGDHSVHAEIDLPSRDHYSLDAGSNLKFTRKNIYLKLLTPRSRLFSLSWNGMFSKWDPKNGNIDVISDISGETPKYGNVKLEGTLSQKPLNKGSKTDASITLSGSKIKTGDMTVNFEMDDKQFEGRLSGKDGDTSFSINSKGTYDYLSKVFSVKGNMDIRVPKTAWEKVHVSITSKVVPEQRFKVSNEIKIQYTSDRSIEIEQDLSFETKDGTNVQGFIKLMTPIPEYKFQKLTFERVYERSSQRNQNKLSLEYGDKKMAGVTANYYFAEEALNMEMTLSTPSISFTKMGFLLDHKIRHRGEVFNTDVQLFLPFEIEVRATNALDLSRASKSVDFKLSFNGEAFVGVVASLENQSRDRYKLSLQLDSEGKKMLMATGALNYRGYSNFDGDVAIQDPGKNLFGDASVQISSKAKGPDSSMTISVTASNTPLIKATLTYSEKTNKFELSGVLVVYENSYGISKTNGNINFLMDTTSIPQITSGKLTLSGQDGDDHSLEFLRTVKNDEDTSQLKMCLKRDCMQAVFEMKHDKKLDLHHDMKLSLKMDDPRQPTSHAVHVKLSKDKSNVDHSLIFSENEGKNLRSLGYQLYYDEDDITFTVVLPTRSVELKGFSKVEDSGEEKNRKFGLEFSVDKQNKPTHKLDVQVQVTETTISKNGRAYKVKAIISHPKFKKKTMSAEGTITVQSPEVIFGCDLDIDLFNEESNKFLLDYRFARKRMNEFGSHNNYTMSLSMRNKYLDIGGAGHWAEKGYLPYNLGLLLTYGGKKLNPKFIFLDLTSELYGETGRLYWLLQNNDKTIEMNNVYQIPGHAGNNFMRSTLMGFDNTPGIASDISFDVQKTASGKPYYQLGFDAYNINEPAKKFSGFIGMPDPKTFEIIALQGPRNDLLTNIYVGLNTTRLLHTRFAWRAHNIKHSLEYSKQRLMGVLDNLSEITKSTFESTNSDIAAQWNKIKFNNKYIKALTSSYERHFTDMSQSLNEVDSLKYLPSKPEGFGENTVDVIVGSLRSIITVITEELNTAADHISKSLPAIPQVLGQMYTKAGEGLYLAKDAVQELNTSFQHYALHNDWYNTYASTVNSILEKIWHRLLDVSSDETEQSWYDIFKSTSERRAISVEEIERRVREVMSAIVSRIEVLDNPFFNMYSDQLKRIYRIGEEEFINLVRFLRNGLGRAIIYQPHWTEIQYEIPLPWPVNDLYDFPDPSSWLSKSRTSNTTITDQYHLLKRILKSSRFIPPFESDAIVSSGGYIMTFDGDFIHYPMNCAYLLAQDFASKKFSLFAHFFPGGMTLVLHTGRDHIEIDSKSLTVKVNHRHVASIPIEGYSIQKSDQGLHFVAAKLGMTIDCASTPLGHASCKVSISGFHHGKSRGLLGTNDNEITNDRMDTNGKITDHVNSFLDSWSTTSQCRNLPLAARRSEGGKAKCESIFIHDSSQYKSCFKFVSPLPYYKACITSDSPDALSKIYSEACALESISLKVY